jgi:hypothetical protein
MRYYLDCEFNGLGGKLISLALAPEINTRLAGFYLANAEFRDITPERMEREYYLGPVVEPWVLKNVLPIIESGGWQPLWAPIEHWPKHLEDWLRGDDDITIVTDWPDDIRYFCDLILTGPGTMIEIRPSIKFEMHRVDAYPTTMPGAVQHNAYSDAMALRHKLKGF